MPTYTRLACSNTRWDNKLNTCQERTLVCVTNGWTRYMQGLNTFSTSIYYDTIIWSHSINRATQYQGALKAKQNDIKCDAVDSPHELPQSLLADHAELYEHMTAMTFKRL